MANTCDYCGDEISPPAYNCNYCDLTLCSDCRLPESHRCAGLSITQSVKVFDSDAPSTLGNSPDRSEFSKNKIETTEISDSSESEEDDEVGSDSSDAKSPEDDVDQDNEDDDDDDDSDEDGAEKDVVRVTGDDDAGPEPVDIDHDLPGKTPYRAEEKSPSVTTTRELHPF